MTQLPLKFTTYSTATPVILPIHERPAYRVAADSAACNTAELLAALIGGQHPVDVAQGLLAQFGCGAGGCGGFDASGGRG